MRVPAAPHAAPTFAIDAAARDYWILLMGAAIDQANVEPATEELLRHFLSSVAHQMQNRE